MAPVHVSAATGEHQRLGHLIATPDAAWTLWRCVGLRGAGFPASRPGLLAAPDASARCDAWLACERVGAPAAERDAAWEAFRLGFHREVSAASDALGREASDHRFREALIWQNRRAAGAGLDAFLRANRAGGSRSHRYRANEEMLASYLQRYCLKNDTIGFFGPVGWATFDGNARGITVRAGAALLADRNVYFEMWCIDALAEALGADERLRPWLVPRRAHFVHLDGPALHLPGRPPLTLPPGEAALLHACDGERSVHEITAELVRSGGEHGVTEQTVRRGLDDLRERGLITLSFEVPFDMHPDQALATRIERIGDHAGRRDAAAALDALREARDRVARAAGRPEALDEALAELEACFTRLTGRAATRSPGQTYAARTLVYEDCRRDVSVIIGGDVLDAIGRPLALLLTAARWLTFEVARRFTEQFDALHASLVQRGGSPDVSFVTFWYRAQPLLFGDGAISAAAAEGFHERWERIIDVAPDERRVQHRSAELREAVSRAFDAPHAGWSHARYHSPDLMIAAEDAAAIGRGDGLFVLGEMHVAANTLAEQAFVLQHAAPDELRRAVSLDCPGDQLELMVPKRYHPGQSVRLIPILPRNTYQLALSSDPASVAASRVIPAGALVVARRGGRLTVRTRDGRLEFALIDVLGPALTRHVSNRFEVLRPRPHVPRVTFDRLVVLRETWRCRAGDMRFAWGRSECERFAEARRLRHELGLPRRVFVKVPIERKPFFVDFDSPVYVNILARHARHTAERTSPETSIVVSEMLPTPDTAWLADSGGNRYTGELRIVAVDGASGLADARGGAY